MATDDNVVSDPKDDEASAKGGLEDHLLEEKAESKLEDKAESKGDVKPVPSPKSKSNSASEPNTSEQAKSDSATTDKVKELEEKLKLAEQKATDHWEEVLRARADLDNTRKRMERDIENAHKYGVEKFVQGLLPVIDSLEMGLAAAKQEDANIGSVKEGTELTLKMFADCVDKFGMQALDPKGEKFNPEFHQAMSIQESNDHEPDTVIAVMQKGYLLNGRLVRPAMVVVAKAGSKTPGNDKNAGGDNEKAEKNS